MHDWRKIEKSYRQIVWEAVYRILRDEDDARDCSQDVFLEAIRRAKDGPVSNWGGFFRWLATRRAIDFVRKRERDQKHLKRFPQDHAVVPEFDGAATGDLEDVVRTELARLPENQAIPFWLFSVEELTYEEIAELTGGSINAVGLRVHRARQTLKVRLTQVNRAHSESHIS